MEEPSVPRRAPACNTGSSASVQGARLPRLRPSAAVVAAASASQCHDRPNGVSLIYVAKPSNTLW